MWQLRLGSFQGPFWAAVALLLNYSGRAWFGQGGEHRTTDH